MATDSMIKESEPGCTEWEHVVWLIAARERMLVFYLT